MTDHTPLTGQQLDEYEAVAARAAGDPFFVTDCEGKLAVWRESALTHVRRDEDGQINTYSLPSSYRSTDEVIETIYLDSWDPGEDATDDQRRQDITDLVDSRAALPALLAYVRRLQGQRKYLITQLAKRDAETGRGDRALREFLAAPAPICGDANDGDWCELEPGHEGHHRADTTEWAARPAAVAAAGNTDGANA